MLAWLSCVVPVKDEQREVLLGVANMVDFARHNTFLGVTVGRYANRIKQGCFTIEGQFYQLETNQLGNTLHGGPDGFDKRRWQISEQNNNSVTFSLLSSHGDQGFPGELQVSVCYCLTEDNQLNIGYQASTTKATLVNLTNHAYFNLMGAESGIDCKTHRLYINADRYLPTDDQGIPLGDFTNVKGTSFNFLEPKNITQDFLVDAQQQGAKGYDHSFILNKTSQKGDCVAEVFAPDDSIKMKVYTTKPALQFYTGNWLAGTPNRLGGEYKDYAGLALETQFLPDSPNHPEWEQPSPILNIGEEYAYQTSYQFIENHE
ncbi:galactose-1-epimerase [Psychromonas sp. KJ10-10]|uniref:galactose-1-epimerase n=1 Tax=Psychromonas sp. KJ10-10 TaxID=3391823 RepID=UPI0039B364F9